MMADSNTLLRWASEHVPLPMIRQLKRFYWRLLAQPDVNVGALEETYGKIERQNWVQSELVAVPDALSMPIAPFAPRLRNGHYKIPEDYVTVLNDVLYCPVNNVVMTEPGQIIAETLCAGINVKPFPRKERPISGFCTPWRTPKNNYYHTLIDNLPRLISLADFPTGTEAPVRLLYSGPLSEAELFYISKFCPPQVEIEKLATDSLYRIEKMIVTPFKTRRYAGYLPDRYAAEIRARLMPNRPATQNHRLLISRNSATRRRILNQDELNEALARRSFEVVSLENLPIEDQIELFHDAEIVVGAHGAGLANILFGNSLNIVELFPCRHIVPHYYFLSQSLGHSYSYLCGKEKSHHSDFVVDVKGVLAMLDAIGITEPTKIQVPMCSGPLKTNTSRTG